MESQNILFATRKVVCKQARCIVLCYVTQLLSL